MTTVNCPLFDKAFYSYELDLDGDTYTFTFRYNERSEAYMLSIADAEENTVISNVKLVPSYRLLQQYSLELPVGDLVLVAYEEGASFEPIPNPRQLSQTHFLIYDTDI